MNVCELTLAVLTPPGQEHVPQDEELEGCRIRKDVTFVSVPCVIICVRLDPSTHLLHAPVCP